MRKNFFWQIIDKNNLYGVDLGEEDKINMFVVSVFLKTKLRKVKGDNTDDDRNTLRKYSKEMVDFYGDRIDFYKKVMDKNAINC